MLHPIPGSAGPKKKARLGECKTLERGSALTTMTGATAIQYSNTIQYYNINNTAIHTYSTSIHTTQ